MRRIIVISFLIWCIGHAVEALGLEYPETQRIDHADVYHGVEIKDAYRWLEEDVRDSKRVRKWVEAENKVTFGYLHSL